jgi:hypothetical protein
MSDFPMMSIEELYDHLEKKTLDGVLSFVPFQLTRTIIAFLDEQKSNITPEQISNLECECKVFRSNSIKIMKDDDPDKIKFSVSEYQYLKNRLTVTKNPFLIARYSHILLLSQEKNKNQYVIPAVDNYLSLVDYYRNSHGEIAKNSTASILWALNQALTISMGFKVQTKQVDVKNKIVDLISTAPCDDPYYSSMVKVLLEIMLNQHTLFFDSDFNNFDEICKKHATVLRNSEVMFFDTAIQLYFLGEKIEKNSTQQKNNWNVMIAETYEELTNKFEKNPLVAVDHCENSIKYYTKANNKEKIAELEQKYLEIRSQVTIPSREIPLEDDEYKKYIRWCDGEVQRVLAEPPDYIFHYLAFSPNIIPNCGPVKEGADILDNSIASQIAGGVLIDKFGNRAKVFQTADEKSRHNFNKMYAIMLNNYSYRLCHQIIIGGIKNKKITHETVMEHLRNSSWIAQSIPFRTVDGSLTEKDWKLLIEPSISHYLSDLEIGIHTNISPIFVMPIDSLILKFEGIMRDLCELNGISPVKHKTHSKNLISEEKNLNDLLRDKQISSFIDENDLFFYKYVFIEKDGINMRNNVAHSLLSYQEYSLFYMNLIFLSILRLTKGRLVEKSN